MNRKGITGLTRLALSLCMGALASSVSLTSFAAEVPEHHHDRAAEPSLKLNAGKRWETDAPLREAMMRIRQAMHGTEALQKAQGFGATQATALAQTIRDSVAYMVANCQLPPDADATLHVLIGRLATAADQLGQGEKRAEALLAIHDTLQLYPQYFDHTGWTGPVHAH
ncbi:MAG: hypothetical protein ACOY3E_09385 [Pseudomonadota bacterium]